MRPEARPRKLTRRSASPKGKVFRMMASVSRAGMRNVGAPTAWRAQTYTAATRAKRARVQNITTYHTGESWRNDGVGKAVEKGVERRQFHFETRRCVV